MHLKIATYVILTVHLAAVAFTACKPKEDTLKCYFCATKWWVFAPVGIKIYDKCAGELKKGVVKTFKKEKHDEDDSNPTFRHCVMMVGKEFRDVRRYSESLTKREMLKLPRSGCKMDSFGKTCYCREHKCNGQAPSWNGAEDYSVEASGERDTAGSNVSQPTISPDMVRRIRDENSMSPLGSSVDLFSANRIALFVVVAFVL